MLLLGGVQASAAETSFASISGKITAPAGIDPSSTTVEAYETNSPNFYLASAWVGSDGSYKFTDLPADSYKLKFSANGTGALDQWHTNAASFDTATAVTVAAGQDLTGINATLVKGATISGKISAPAGVTIGNTRVEAYAPDTDNYVASTYAGSDGSYKVIGLPAGSYKLKFGGSSTGALEQWHSNAVSFDTATAVTVTSAQDLAGINATLVKGATVSGKITAPAGVDVSGTSAELYKANSADSFVESAWVGSDGSYKFTGLPAGSYKVKFAGHSSGALDQWHSNATSFTTATAVTLTTGQDLSGISATLVKGATVSGKITAPAGVEVGNTRVEAYKSDNANSYVGSAYVESDGSYKITGLPAGSYKLNYFGYNSGALDQWHSNAASFDTATAVALATGQDLAGINATLVKGATISGKITAPAGVTLTSTYVYVHKADDPDSNVESAWVGSDGSYKVVGLPAGSYKLNFTGYNNGALDQWHSNAASFDTATAVTLTTGQDLTGINATLVKGATIGGKITAPAGVTLANTYVYAYNANFSDSAAESASVASDGSYKIVGLPAGNYKLKVEGYNTGALVQWHSNAVSFDTATAVTLTTGQDLAGVNATLVKGATISGTISAPVGTDLTDTQVDLYRTDSPYWPTAYAYSGSDGSYKFTGLAAGSYKLKFTGSGTGTLDQWHVRTESFDTATVITLTTGQDLTGINATLVKGATVGGKVTAPAGIDVTETYAQLYKADSATSAVRSVRVDPDGGYKFSGLPAGSYKVKFSNSTGSLDQWYNNAASFETATAITVTTGQDLAGINATLVKGATISGKVTPPIGVSVSGTWVYAYKADDQHSNVDTVYIGTDGSYRFTGLAAGSYKLRYAGHSSVTLDQWYTNATSFDTATAVTVTTGQDVVGINATLVKGASISGKITAPAGVDLGNTSVVAYKANDADSNVKSVSVGPDGSYKVAGLPAGNYKLNFSGSSSGALDQWHSNAASFDTATVVVLAAGQDRTGINATLVKGATISGKITAPVGVTLTNTYAYVYAADNSSYNVGSVPVGSDGSYKVTGLPAGSYKLKFAGNDTGALEQWHSNAASFDTATAVSLTAGQDLAGINATLVKGATISGKITAPVGVSLSTVKAYAYKSDNEYFSLGSSFLSSNGSYKIAGLPAGSYKLKFAGTGSGALDQWHSNAATFATATAVTVTAGQDLAGINATLVKGASISGKVTAPAGVTLNYFRADAYKSDSANYSVGTAYVGTDGSYKITGLPAGSYKVSFSGYDSGALDYWHSNAASFDTATAVTLSAGQDLAGINATLVKGATVSGKVTAPAGVTVANTYVYAYKADDAGFSVESAWVGSDGGYKIVGLPAGSYKVKFTGGGGGALDQWHSNAASFDTATAVTVTTGQDLAGINATLAKGATITGKITAPAGTSVAGTYVYAFKASEPSAVESAYVGSDGSYKIVGLPAGSYKVRFTGGSGGALEQWHSNAASFDTATAISLTNGQDLAGINATLAKGATVSGKVTASAGVTLAGANVYAYKSDNAALPVASASVSPDGSYKIIGLPTGNYKVRFLGFNSGATDQWYGGTTFETATTLALTAGLDRASTNFAAQIGGSIAGKISGAADGYSPVTVLDVTGKSVKEGYSDRAGNFSVVGLAAGSYKVAFNRSSGFALEEAQFYQDKPESAGVGQAATVTVQTGKSVPNINATLTAGGTISGTVVDKAAKPLAYADVFAYTVDGSLVTRRSFTDAAGKYAVTGLTTGKYVIKVKPRTELGDLYSGNVTSEAAAAQVGATAGVTSTLNLSYALPALSPAPVPTVTGTAKVGSTLTANPGVWGPAPVTLAYQWKANGVVIVGATAPTYKPVSGNVGKTITVSVTGTKPGYTTAVKTSAATAAVTSLPALSPAPVPTVTGTAKVGSTLTAAPGVWGPAPVTLAYQWKANGVSILGATASTYKPVSGNVGKTITVSVTGTKSGYTTAVKTSAATAAVTALPALSPAPLPTVTGTAKVGSVLTASPGVWGPAPVTLAYQWKANGVSIVGATAATYTPVAGDVGKTVTVSVTGTKSGYTTAVKTSAATAAVAAAPVLSPAPVPTVTGVAKVGSVLTANPGVWGPAPVALAYQWKANGVAVVGATAATYTPVAGDVGKTVTVSVTGTKAGYATAEKTSAATAAVAALPVLSPAPVPTVTGTAKVGSVLTAGPGVWGPAPVTLAYQWKANGVAIVGATATTYKPVTGDVGKTITVSVTGTKAGYTTAVKTSAATAAVAALPALSPAPVPKVTGTAKVGSELTATPGVWGPAPVALTYQWKADGVAIVGAIAATYKPVTGDVGKKITVSVTGKKAGYATAVKTSVATASVF